MEYIFASVITGVLALAGTVVTCLSTSKKTDHTIQLNQAVTDTKIEELTREVREHNGFATRVPVLEAQIKTLEHRINNIEKRQNGGKEK